MSDAELVVQTRAGRVRGVEQDGMLRWRGIPYAAAPVGVLRHRPPRPVDRWPGVRLAAELPAIAWQSPDFNAPPVPGAHPSPPPDEDCLHLCVTRPAGAVPASGWPVMVWLHGGGYLTGSPALDSDGWALARHGIIVVSVAYRLGAFGFLQLSELLGSAYAGSGAVGLLDQVQALHWVRDNIAEFGGDPGRVTIYGISAGAKSVANILSLPGTRDLVHRAISSSGGGEHVATREQAGLLTARFLAVLGLSDSTAHRVLEVPAAEMLGAQEVLGTGLRATYLWRPVVAGLALPDLPISAIGRGSAAGIPLLIGNNGREAATFAMFDRAAPAQSDRVLAEQFGEPAVAVIRSAYRHRSPAPSAQEIDVAIMGDERYGIPTIRLAEAQVPHAPVWRYRFDSAVPGISRRLAGGHGMDQAAVWSAHRFEGDADPARAAAAGLHRAVAAFTRGDGQGPPNLPRWPRYTLARRETMILDANPHIEADPRSAERQAWQGRSWESGTWWGLDDLHGKPRT